MMMRCWMLEEQETKHDVDKGKWENIYSFFMCILGQPAKCFHHEHCDEFLRKSYIEKKIENNSKILLVTRNIFHIARMSFLRPKKAINNEFIWE